MSGKKRELPPMTDVIVARAFEWHDDRGDAELVVRIGRPAPFPDGKSDDWYCPVELEMVEHDLFRHRYSGGVDALQALWLALVMIGVELEHDRRAGRITWLGQRDLGFPVPDWPAPTR